MQFGKGIQSQGKPFEKFVQKSLPEGTIDLNVVKDNFSTFDHLTMDGTAISTKTLDTGAVSYQKASDITYKLNQYIDQMVAFERDGKTGGIVVTSDDITKKVMQLGIPYQTTSEQLAGVAKSIEYAKNLNPPIEIIVTKVK